MKYKYAFVIEVVDGEATVTYEMDYTTVAPEAYESWNNVRAERRDGFVVSIVEEMDVK